MARISPSWGFSLAVSGSTMPLLVISSRGVGLTTTRSPWGWSLVFVAVANVFLLGTAEAVRTCGLGRLAPGHLLRGWPRAGAVPADPRSAPPAPLAGPADHRDPGD